MSNVGNKRTAGKALDANKLVECAVCRDTVSNVAVQCTSGHPFCQTCVQNETKCPICRILMDPSNPIRWMPCISVSDILLSVQTFLEIPYCQSPAQEDAYRFSTTNMPMYKHRVREQANKYTRESHFADELVKSFPISRSRDWRQVTRRF